MNQITAENFRCFRAKQAARLAPLTLLVGENGTGKTSFLALMRALWDAAFRWVIPDFKETPYDLGSFDDIIHHRGRGTARPQEFTAGFSVVPNLLDRRKRVPRAGSSPCRVEFTFARHRTAPVPTTVLLACEDLAVTDTITDGTPQEIHLRTARGEWLWRVPAEFRERFARDDSRLPQLFTHPGAAEAKHLTPVGGSPKITDDDRARLDEIFSLFDEPLVGPRPFASAPVRSRALRTYDPSRPTRDPEGETVPMYLSTAYFEDEKSWKALKGALEGFGHEAGLFDEITVRPLGQHGSEPFQLQIRRFGRRAKGPPRNLIDVGYGVSQVLPVITELFRDSDTPLSLLQQPEVYLHPSAQAALGSLFCEIAGPRRQLVVETHSDHLLDRVRMDVRDAKTELKPDDVSILFFERDDLHVRIHSLRLDGEGNVLDAPSSYRRFFMEETRRSLRL